MPEEEADHFAAGVRAAWLGVRSLRAPAGPGVAAAMQRPMLQDSPAALILLTHAGVFDPAKRLTPVHGARQVCAGFGLCDHLVAVNRTDGVSRSP